MLSTEPLVTVVIPAYNAACTVSETLKTVRAQTHSNLQILIVDDGSIDKTGEIVQSIAKHDGRIEVIRQMNAGVASARNTAIRLARGKYVAPIDADDLWNRRRVSLHVAALESAGPSVAVAYSPFYKVDHKGNVVGRSALQTASGNVFAAQLRRNLVGNGSGMTIRRDALVAVGGYRTWLHEQGAQGCEDYLLQLELAHRYEYVCVPERLIGYRAHRGNMSSNAIQMLRSQLLMYQYLVRHLGLGHRVLEASFTEVLGDLVKLVCRRHGVLAGAREAARWSQCARDAAHISRCLGEMLYRKALRTMRRVPWILARKSDGRSREEAVGISDSAVGPTFALPNWVA